MTVKLVTVLIVRAHLKSTRHKYVPLSPSITGSMIRNAFIWRLLLSSCDGPVPDAADEEYDDDAAGAAAGFFRFFPDDLMDPFDAELLETDDSDEPA